MSTLKELKNYCRKNKLKGYSKLKKVELEKIVNRHKRKTIVEKTRIKYIVKPKGYNKKFWNYSIKEANKKKKWALERINDKKWMKNASYYSTDNAIKKSKQSIYQIAKEIYNYDKSQAFGVSLYYGSPSFHDKKNKALWENITGERLKINEKTKKVIRVKNPEVKNPEVKKIVTILIGQIKQKQKLKTEHVINIEEWRAISKTLNPIETIITIFAGKYPQRGLNMSNKLTKKDTIQHIKTNKITELELLIKEKNFSSYNVLTNISAESIKKKIWKKQTIDFLQDYYTKKRKIEWEELKIEYNKRNWRFEIRFDESDYHKPSNISRTQWGKALDIMENKIHFISFPFPKTNPLEKNFIIALNKHY